MCVCVRACVRVCVCVCVCVCVFVCVCVTVIYYIYNISVPLTSEMMATPLYSMHTKNVILCIVCILFTSMCNIKLYVSDTTLLKATV